MSEKEPLVVGHAGALDDKVQTVGEGALATVNRIDWSTRHQPDHPEYQYLDMLRDCLDRGVYREGRNGGTYGLFGRQIRFNLAEGFPLLTTKKVNFKAVAAELLWFLRGETNVKILHEHGVHIWDANAEDYTKKHPGAPEGELGPVYGRQWRNWGGKSFMDRSEEGIDQIQNAINTLMNDPYSRRNIITAWNPEEIEDMALPPCHCLCQFFVADGKLSCQLYQRSADMLLGVPFNIASYALLTHLMAREAGLEVGEFIHTFGDFHVYHNHIMQVREQLTREPRPFPTFFIDSFVEAGIFNLSVEDLTGCLYEYNPHPPIQAEMSV